MNIPVAIKKYFYTAGAAFMVCVLLLNMIPIRGGAEASNTIPNPNVSESSDGAMPDYWYQDSWGNNTAVFSYVRQGYADASALQVQMNSYTDGDAKWYFAPITVHPSTGYVFSDYYQSTTYSNIWARFVSPAGTVTYKWLGYVSASSAWAQKSITFTTPADVAAVSILHVLTSVGTLTTDSYSLAEAPLVPACDVTVTNGIANASFEQSCDGGITPAEWQKNSVGAITSQLTYEKTGYSGTKSVGMNITAANGGEVSWSFKPVSVIAGKRYQYSCWVKSTIGAYTYTEEQHADGTYSYAAMMSAPATGNSWSYYVDAFIASSTTSAASVYFATDKVGSVMIDDCSLVQLPDLATNNFTRGMVSIAFDDGWRTTYTNGLPVMNQFGYKATYYVNYSKVGTSGYMTKNQLKTLASQGNEIGSHAYEHINLPAAEAATVDYEVKQNQQLLSQLLSTAIKNFADPYGAYNSSVVDTVMHYHQSNRDTSGMLNKKYNFNPRLIHSWGVDKNTTMTDINNLIKQAKTQNAWLVLVYHDIPTGNGGAVDSISVATLKKHLSAIKSSGLPVLTVDKAFQEAASQL